MLAFAYSRLLWSARTRVKKMSDARVAPSIYDPPKKIDMLYPKPKTYLPLQSMFFMPKLSDTHLNANLNGLGSYLNTKPLFGLKGSKTRFRNEDFCILW